MRLLFGNQKYVKDTVWHFVVLFHHQQFVSNDERLVLYRVLHEYKLNS